MATYLSKGMMGGIIVQVSRPDSFNTKGFPFGTSVFTARVITFKKVILCFWYVKEDIMDGD